MSNRLRLLLFDVTLAVGTGLIAAYSMGPDLSWREVPLALWILFLVILAGNLMHEFAVRGKNQ